MILRPFLNDESSCASYLFGCLTHAQLAVVDPHADLVDAYLEAAAAIGAPIIAVFETHVQADHVSGLPALVERTGARAYLPVDAGVEFEHDALADGDEVEMGNTIVRALATPGHAPAHHAYLVVRSPARDARAVARVHRRLAADRRRRPARSPRRGRPRGPGADAARLARAPARAGRRRASCCRATTPARSVAARSRPTRSPRSASSVTRTRCSAYEDPDAFAAALLEDTPPRPPEQEAIVAHNRRGTVSTPQ